MRFLYILAMTAVICNVRAGDVSEFRNKVVMYGKAYFDESVENGEFQYILHLAEYGHREAIEIAPELIRYSDASLTESIKNALGRGLTKNPRAVLRLVPQYFSLEEICTVPFFEAPQDIEEIHIRQVIENLEGMPVENGKMAKARDGCLEIFKRY